VAALEKRGSGSKLYGIWRDFAGRRANVQLELTKVRGTNPSPAQRSVRPPSLLGFD